MAIYILFYSFCYLFFYTTQFALPIYSFKYNNEDITENYKFLCICIFNVFFIQNINIYYVEKLLYNDNTYIFNIKLGLYKILIMIYCLILFVSIIKYEKMNFYYFYCVIVPVYICPFILINLIIFFKNIQSFFVYLNETLLHKFIKILN